MEDTPNITPIPDKKRRGRVGKVIKKDAVTAAEFVPIGSALAAGESVGMPAGAMMDEAEDGGGQAAGAEAMEAGKVIDFPDDAALLKISEEKEREAARVKLKTNQPITARERKLLERGKREGREGKAAGGYEFNPGKIAESINAWWVNGDGGQFQLKDQSTEWLQVPETKLALALKRRGLSDFPVGGEALSRIEQTMLHVVEHRTLDQAIEAVAGYKAGVHDIKSAKVLVRKGPRLIEPKEGTWDNIAEMLQGRLVLDDGDVKGRNVQLDRFHCWMARAVENIYNSPGVRLNSQVLILAGPIGSAKSRLQHMIITPLLGGRSADPSRYVFGETTFNSGFMGCEHLLIEDPRPSMKMLDRLQLAQILKAFTVNDDQSFHKKQKDEFGVNPEFVVTISINDDPDSLRILPPLTPDFQDKVMLFRVVKRDLAMPTGTGVERLAFQKSIRDELPAYLWWLLNECEMPPSLRSDRFGILHYHEPGLRLALWEDTPSSELLALMDGAVIDTEMVGGIANKRPFFDTSYSMTGAEAVEKFRFAKPDSHPSRLVAACVEKGLRVWCGSYQNLQAQLEACQHPRLARKLIEHNSVQRLLSRLAEDMPERIAHHRTATERLWFVQAPPSMTGDAQ